MPADPARRYETIQWLMFQMGGIGPMFGQVGFFHKFAGKDYEDKRPRDRYVAEAKRLLGVLERRLAGRALDHGRRLHASPTSRPSRGSATWSASTARGELVGFDAYPNVHAGARRLRRAAGGAGGPLDSESRHPLNRAGLSRPRPTESHRPPRYGGADRHPGPMP